MRKTIIDNMIVIVPIYIYAMIKQGWNLFDTPHKNPYTPPCYIW